MTTRALWPLLLLCATGCLELDKARPYECRRDAGLEDQCPGGWFCTVEGRCRSKEQGGEFPCERLNPDGGADPKGGEPNDCGSRDWWCGARGVCQRIGEARAYPCDVDNDCEGGWRCSLDSVCVAPAHDALDASTFGTTEGPELVSPLFGAQGIAFVAPSASGVTVGSGDAGDPKFEVLVLAAADGGVAGLLREQFENGFSGQIRLVPASFTVPGLRAVGQSDCRVYFLKAAADGGSTLAFSEVGARDGQPFIDPPQDLVTLPSSARLRTSNRLGGTNVVFSGTEWAVHGYGLRCGLLANAAPLPLPETSPQRPAVDLAFLGDPRIRMLGPLPLTANGAWVLSTESGLFIIGEDELASQTWRALGGINAPNERCGPRAANVTVRIEQLRTLGESVLAGMQTVTPNDGGAASRGLVVQLLYLPAWNNLKELLPDGGERYPQLRPDGGCSNEALNLIAVHGPCEPCTPNYPHLQDYTPIVFALPDGGLRSQLEGFCSVNPDASGGLELFQLTNEGSFTSAQCKRRTLRYVSAASRYVFNTSNSARHARIDTQRGGIWFGESPVQAAPLFFDEPPKVMIRAAAQANTLVVSDRLFGQLQKDAGFLSFPTGSDPDFYAQVEGQPSWFATPEGVYVLQSVVPAVGVPVAQAPVEGYTARGLGFGTVVTTRGGGTELVVASGDTVYTANVTATLDGGTFAELKRRVTPLAAARITSLAASSPGPKETLFARAYARTAAGVFELRAETPIRWRAFDAELPGDPLIVFSDGLRARAGYDDGTVMTLPGRLVVAPPLDPSAVPAVDFVSVCGQPWVLARGGVFKLELGAGPVGNWTPVDFDSASPPHLKASSPDLYEDGKLLLRADDVWLFLSDGTALKRRVSCPNAR